MNKIIPQDISTYTADYFPLDERMFSTGVTIDRSTNERTAKADGWLWEYKLQELDGEPRMEDAVEPRFKSTQHSLSSFSMKRDQLSGFDFRGARYYDSEFGVFLSVDPLADQFAAWTPYHYVHNNPLRYTDPDGRSADDIIYKDQDGTEVHREIQDGDDIIVNVTSVTITGQRGSSGSPNYGDTEVGVLGSVASAKKFDMFNSTQWKGTNGKYYNTKAAPGKANPFYGNQHTGSVNTAKGKAAKVGVAGSVLGIYSMAATHMEYKENSSMGYGPNMTRHLNYRYGVDQAANGAGFLGFWGAIGSLGYNAGHMIESVFGNIQYNPITKDFTPIERTLMEYDALGIDLAPKK